MHSNDDTSQERVQLDTSFRSSLELLHRVQPIFTRSLLEKMRLGSDRLAIIGGYFTLLGLTLQSIPIACDLDAPQNRIYELQKHLDLLLHRLETLLSDRILDHSRSSRSDRIKASGMVRQP